MLIRSFAAPMFATNCWVIAPASGAECLIVDPGMPDLSRQSDIAAEVELIVAENRLKPVAVLVTHGHLDHTFSIRPLADGYDIPAYIHSEDRRFIANPSGIHGAQFIEMIGGLTFKEPAKIVELKNGTVLDLLGLNIEAIHAPGHTRGSVMYKVNSEILLSGDVLFAGSIGRTDLPTGSPKEMTDTLLNKVLPLSDDLRVLPGLGPETNIKFERKNNPYLKELLS